MLNQYVYITNQRFAAFLILNRMKVRGTYTNNRKQIVFFFDNDEEKIEAIKRAYNKIVYDCADGNYARSH